MQWLYFNADICLMHVFSLIKLTISCHLNFENRLVDLGKYTLSLRNPLYLHVEHQNKCSKGREVVTRFFLYLLHKLYSQESDSLLNALSQKMSVVICLNNQTKKLSSEEKLLLKGSLVIRWCNEILCCYWKGKVNNRTMTQLYSLV